MLRELLREIAKGANDCRSVLLADGRGEPRAGRGGSGVGDVRDKSRGGAEQLGRRLSAKELEKRVVACAGQGKAVGSDPLVMSACKSPTAALGLP